MDEIEVSNASIVKWLTVSRESRTALAVDHQGGVRQLLRQSAGRNMIDKNLIGATASRKLAVGCQRDGVNRQRPPFQGRGGANLALRALVDPELDQPQLLRRQIERVDLIIFGGHAGLLLMRSHFQQQTLGAFARHDRGPGFTALEDGLRIFQNQIGFGLGLVVTGQAIVFEDRQNLFFKINRTGSLGLDDGNGRCLGRNRLRIFRPKVNYKSEGNQS